MIKVMIVGQKWLAEQLLKLCLLMEGVVVVSVSPPTRADRVAILAKKHGILITEHDRLLMHSQVPAGTDIILTAHAYCFVTAEARSKAKFGAVGYHPSMLPKYKGKRAITDVLEAGETMTGGTLYQLNDDWDGGDILLQESITIDSHDDATTLWRNKLAPLGLKLFKVYLHYLK